MKTSRIYICWLTKKNGHLQGKMGFLDILQVLKTLISLDFIFNLLK